MSKAQKLREQADRLEAKARFEFDQAMDVVRSLRETADEYESGRLPLTPGNSYVTDGAMASTQNLEKHPGPRATKGPMAVLAKELGLGSLRALAEALGEEHQNVRSWNHRKSVPDRVTPAIKRLRDQRRAAAEKAAETTDKR